MFRFASITLTLCLATIATQATTVSVVAAGVAGETQQHFYDPQGLLPFSQPPAGTPFTMRFTYDSETPDIRPDPTFGEFRGAISDISLSIGNLTFPAFAENVVVVSDGNGGYGGDVWVADSYTDTPPLRTYISLLLFSIAGNSFGSDALITPSFPRSGAYIDYAIEDRTDPNQRVTLARAEAQVDSIAVTLVPAPATLWLMGTALASLGWRRRL